MYKDVIGLVGGMGTYATLDFFERIIKAFPAEKEWDRPRIIIDNRCTMPSRVRAVLYDENKELLIEELTKAVDGLIYQGATKILFVCNTSHLFLEDVFMNIPQAREMTLNIIDELALSMSRKKISDALLIATEGTVLSKIYDETFIKYDIKIKAPEEKQFKMMRGFIEAVKTDSVNSKVAMEFIEFIKSFNCDKIILGCTEFPLIYKYVKDEIKNLSIDIYDPLESAIDKLKKEIK